jgi:hypothetical protein
MASGFIWTDPLQKQGKCMKAWTTAKNKAPHFATGDGVVTEANDRALVMGIIL